MRALVNDGATASRQEPPCTTPDELVKAVAEMPRIRPPEPAFTAPPEYQRTTYQQGTYGRPPPAPPSPSPSVPPPPPLQGRTGKALKWAVSALLIAALGLGSWQLADTLLHRDKGSNETGNTQTTDHSDGDGDKPKAPVPLKIAGRHRVLAQVAPQIQENQVKNAVDGDPSTAWITPQYKGGPNLGNLPNRKDGSGHRSSTSAAPRTCRLFDIAFYRPGQTVEVMAADPGASHPSALAESPSG